MKLGEYLEIAAYDIAFWLTAFANPDYPVEQLGGVCEDVCAKLRTAAVIALVAKGDHRLFTHNLVRSGRCRLSYLQRVRLSGRPDYHDASSRTGGYLDTVAAADFALAREIVAHSPRDWRADAEYEDDWCHAQVAHAVIAPVADATRVSQLLERWEQVLDGQPDARLPVLRSLALRNAAGFEQAFAGLLDAREQRIAAERARARIEEFDVIAERQVDVEALALLRMATQLGFPTQGEYRGCPSLARAVTREPLPPEW